MKKKRIFWLGMHKILISTELKRLRMLGYEVFNPPYLSPIIDQSSILDRSAQINSTLPPEAIATLSATNFYYNRISPEVAEILNYYFDIAIITINPVWLKNFLKAYHGKTIYRVYGQHYRLSEYIVNNKILDLISEREDFWFCPHHKEALHTEDLWLKRFKIRIIPYCLSDDIIALENHWGFRDPYHSVPEYNDLGLMCPRILDNDYYNRYYKLIKKYFSDEQFKIFGSQIVPISDPQVVGTLERETFLKRFSQLRGFIYHFKDPIVCYLPPIEFMTLGGPVVFLKGSLLSRYFSQPPPGEAKNFSMLIKLAQQLKSGNLKFINEIIKSQEEVRALYHPSTVWPLFDDAMTEILSTNKTVSAPNLLYNTNTLKNDFNKEKTTEKSYFIPFHKFGPNIEVGLDASYYSAEGIIRVTRLMVQTLTQCNTTVIVTSYRSDFGKIHGFFTAHINNFTKLKILILEDNPPPTVLKKASNNVRLSLKKMGVTKIIKTILLFLKIKPTFQNIRLYLNFFSYLKKVNDTPYINVINQDKSISQIIVPHYYLYPEVLSSIKPVLLYLPDYLPYFYKGSLEMGDHWVWRKIGKKIAQKANTILTNSEFTRNYLPHCRLKIKKEKIIHIPLAYLPQHTKTDKLVFSTKLAKKLPDLFIFYPTRDRPSKRLSDFLEILRIINHRLKMKNETKRIYGVLTTPFLNRKNTDKYVINLPTLSDLDLTQVYQLARALVFTSENEGNFPTQIHEALYLNTPVIATNIPQITLELGEISNFLQLVDVGDCEKFADAVLYTIDNREKVLIDQEKVRDYAKKYFSYDQFSSKFLEIFDKNFKPLTQEILR